MNSLAAAGWKREQVIACSKFADDFNGESCLLDIMRMKKFTKETYRVPFDDADDFLKFLDMRKKKGSDSVSRGKNQSSHFFLS